MFVFGMMSGVSAQEIYYSETFDDGLPAEWFTEGDGWLFGNGSDVSSQFFGVPDSGSGVVCFNDDALGEESVGGGRLESGPIDLTAATGEVLFQMNYYFPNLDYQDADETVIMYVSTDAGASYEEFMEFDGEGLAFTVGFADLTEFAGSTINIALEYNDGAQWNFGFAIDGIEIADGISLIKNRDYSVTAGASEFIAEAKIGAEYSGVSGIITNRGLENMESFDIVISDGTTEIVESISGVDLARGQVMGYSIDETIIVPEGTSTWTVSIRNINGSDELDASLNGSFSLNGLAGIHPNKAVMVEEATGTWCTWCPRGDVFLDEMTKRFGSSFVGVAVHNQDPMVLSAYDSGITSFPGFQGFPGVIYNRDRFLDPSEIAAPSILDMFVAPTVGISIGGELDGTGALTASIEVNFLEDANVDYNVSIIITEDGITGTSSGYAQVNAYSGGAQGPMGGYELLPSPVPASMMVYDHVGRGLIGGFSGVPNVVSGDYLAGDIKSYRFDPYNVPADMNTDNVHVIGVITDASSGEIVNVKSVSFEDALASGLSTSISETFDNTYADVYPNLVVDQTTIYMTLEETRTVKAFLVNSIGQTVTTQNYGQNYGQVELQFDMTNVNAGLYYLHIQADDKLITKKLTKAE